MEWLTNYQNPLLQPKSHFKAWRSLLQEIRKAWITTSLSFNFIESSQQPNSYRPTCVVSTNSTDLICVAHKDVRVCKCTHSGQTCPTLGNNRRKTYEIVQVRGAVLYEYLLCIESFLNSYCKCEAFPYHVCCTCLFFLFLNMLFYI